MRSAKLGDVYAVKVPNGYKIVQWAYRIERFGKFIRVFDGLYDTIPADIAGIVEGDHSYIIDLFVGRAYRIGLLEWLGNYPVPEKYPCPEHDISFWHSEQSGVFAIWIGTTPVASDRWGVRSYKVGSIAELPEEFQHVKMLRDSVSPDWLLYLFDNNYSLTEPEKFWPWVYWGENWKEKYQIYIDIVADALKKDPKSQGILNGYLEK